MTSWRAGERHLYAVLGPNGVKLEIGAGEGGYRLYRNGVRLVGGGAFMVNMLTASLVAAIEGAMRLGRGQGYPGTGGVSIVAHRAPGALKSPDYHNEEP